MDEEEKLSIEKLLDEKEKIEFKYLELEQKKNQEIEQLKDEIAKLKLEIIRLTRKLETKEEEVKKGKEKIVTEKVYVPVHDERETKFWELKLNEISQDYEKKSQEKDNKIAELELIKRDLENKLGVLKSTVLTFEDMIRELKLHVDEIVAKNFYLQIELYKKFSDGVFRRLKNYIATINILTKLLREKVKDKKVINYINTVAKQTKNITSLFDAINIHLFPPHKLELSPCLLDDILGIAIKEVENETEKIVIKKEFNDNNSKINADLRWIKKAIVNVLINAIESIPDTGEIVISTETKNSKVLIKISDTGIGFDETVMDELFTPFFTTKKDNIGLGLFIAKIIIQVHQGDIGIRSVKGKGTTVNISLPIILSS